MTRSIAITSLVGLALVLSGAARADRLGKGSSLVFGQLGGHRGEFVSVTPGLSAAGFPGSVFRNETGEVGGEIGYYRFLSDEWTLGFSGGYHASSMKNDEAGFGSETVDTHSFTVRIGGDRFAFIDDRAALYAGPGLFVTRGRWKSKEDFTIEGPDVTEVGLNGRIGMYARLGNGYGLVGHIGQVLSHASGKNSIGKVSWWSSTHEGAVGMAFDF